MMTLVCTLKVCATYPYGVAAVFCTFLISPPIPKRTVYVQTAQKYQDYQDEAKEAKGLNYERDEKCLERRARSTLNIDQSGKKTAHNPTNIVVTINEGAYDRQGGTSQLSYEGYNVGCYKELDDEPPGDGQTVVRPQVSGYSRQKSIILCEKSARCGENELSVMTTKVTISL